MPPHCRMKLLAIFEVKRGRCSGLRCGSAKIVLELPRTDERVVS
jgi:hypothetical protein